MELEIRRHNVHLTEALRDHIERRLSFALGPFNSRVGTVSVHFEDVNGPKGGVDKQCRILVTLSGGKVIKVEDLDADLTAVIDRAADRIGHAVRREIDRRQDRRTSGTSLGEISSQIAEESAEEQRRRPEV